MAKNYSLRGLPRETSEPQLLFGNRQKMVGLSPLFTLCMVDTRMPGQGSLGIHDIQNHTNSGTERIARCLNDLFLQDGVSASEMQQINPHPHPQKSSSLSAILAGYPDLECARGLSNRQDRDDAQLFPKPNLRYHRIEPIC